ncbi:radical SAM protein [uncultured Paludibaculum sp.]|uniref:SPL family radical SAM protein n=1 Tax=uncultured Paludibaculum sp. TaxID=1765020 RepID=UPI002AAA9383|nr:radical SAM protein [uncultured Paludibaculum sp.]
MFSGIAKLAHEGGQLEQKARVQYRELDSRHLLNRCSSERMPFEWTINPYRGCEFGCQYCYARYTHEFMEYREPLDFERKIFAKRFDLAAFSAELRTVRPDHWIAIGTATDPYQPAERRYRLTRKILGVFARRQSFNLAITTKSDLVARDVDLLVRIAKSNNVRVNMTVTTTDTALARLLEPMAPRPDLRLAALRRLSTQGIETSVFACPVMPAINDSRESLAAVAKAAAEAGARNFGAQVVFLKPCARAVFLPFLEKSFPQLARAYHDHFDREATIRGAYPERIKGILHELRAEHGLSARWPENAPKWQGSFDFSTSEDADKSALVDISAPKYRHAAGSSC